MADFHVAMFPWLAIGHMIPYIQLANELASRGHRISILVPNKTLLKLKHLILHSNLIVFHPLTVPNVDGGLPPGTETVSDIPLNSNHLLASAMDLMQDQVEKFLSSAKADLVFYDFAHWIPDIAKKFGIKSVCYHVVSATALAYSLVPARNVPKHRPLTKEEVRAPPAGFPSSSIVLRADEVNKSILMISPPPSSESEGCISFFERLTTSMKSCDALSIRTCRELEGKFCDYIGSQYGKPVLLTGSALPAPAKTLLENRWDEWLSRFERGSVVFCAFGSQYVLEKDQFQELVLGFELTGLPFFVALKPPVGCTTMQEALPEGFEERVRGRGLVYGGWVQQPLILSHRSVGCFVSHCGFGSMWEGLMSDNQIVLVPQLGDQMLNTRLLVEELKVAVEVVVDKELDNIGWFSKESLSRAVKCVMDKDSEVGIMVKKNHGKLKDDLVKPGLMCGYFDKFVEDLHELCN